MLLADLVATSAAVAATSSRTAKRDALAALLAELDDDEVAAAVGLLTGDPRQGRVGVGWATLARLEPHPAAHPTLTVGDLDTALDRLARVQGSGSGAERERLLGDLLARATEAEDRFVRDLLVGELRQGALAGVMNEAVARAAAVPAAAVRRAAMLSGDLGRTAELALAGGRSALEDVGLTIGVAVQPMLAATAESVDEALADVGEASVEWKLDGIRVQVHRSGGDVTVFTRNLNDVTSRLPELVELCRSFPSERFVLDGETIGVDEDRQPRRFQDTASRFGREDLDQHQWHLEAAFFDLLHVDDRDLLDEPLTDRRARLADLVGAHVVPGVITDRPDEAGAVLDAALAQGHEGVMVKDAGSPYLAGRRGRAWRKVKPVHTLDLVVLGAEWGHGRRRGLLSNLHLGARDPEGGFVMVGKTFKGLTDELLTWQTEALLARRRSGPATDDHGRSVVWVQPELVVEIAVDGVQVSTRYPGGVALRFARVRGYRPDKEPVQADTIETVRALLGGP